MRSEKRAGLGYVAIASRVARLAVLSGIITGSAGCLQTVHHLSPAVERPASSLVFFLVDGLDHARLQEMLAAGELPNVRRQFVENGVQVRHAVASLPSVTYPNCTSFITGRFPGHHGIMGNYWFDRSMLVARYYMTLETYLTVNEHFSAPTLYDALRGEFTLNIQDHTRRGVSATIDNKGMFAWNWMWGRYTRADYRVGDSIDDAIHVANRAGKWPRTLMTYYPGVDEIGHRHGSASAEYRDALHNIDEVVGRVTRELEASGAGPLYYCLASDHSHSPIRSDQRMDLLKWLRERRGVRLWSGQLSESRSIGRRARKMEAYDAVVAVDAGRVVMIHLPGAAGWCERPTEVTLQDWINRDPPLLSLPAVDMVLMRAGPEGARVITTRGSAVLERRVHEGVKQYRIADMNGDPLRADGRPEFSSFIAAGWHGSRAWLERSAAEAYPDFVPQAVEMFDSPRTGDLVVMAAEGWGFATGPAENGGHGSGLACDVRIPLMFSGPDLPHGASIACARLVDVMPTVLGLLGEAHRLEQIPPIDGVNLAEALRAAR